MGGNKPKRSRAQSIYFVGPAKLQPWSRLEAEDTGPYHPLVRPLVWQAAKRVLAETMVNAKEPYAIYKLMSVLKRAPRIQHLKELKPNTAHSFSPVPSMTRDEIIKMWGKREFSKISLAAAAIGIGKKKEQALKNGEVVRGRISLIYPGYIPPAMVNNGKKGIAKKISPAGEVDYVAYGTGSKSDQKRIARMKKKSR